MITLANKEQTNLTTKVIINLHSELSIISFFLPREDL